MGGLGGLLGLAIIIGDIWAVVNVLQSSASDGAKIAWTLFILFMPLIGLIVWYFAGPRKTAW